MENNLLSYESKNYRSAHGIIRALFASLTFVVACGCLDRVAAEDPVVTDGTNRIFMKSLSRLLAEGEAMQTILGVDASDMQLTPDTKNALSKEIQRLPAAEKNRLMLLRLLCFDYDGEKAEMLGEDLGDDKVRVGETLSRISDNDFRKACSYLGVPENRTKMFRTLVNRWRSEDKKPKNPPNQH